MVVDDNVDAALSLAEAFALLGIQAAVAHDGAEALATASAGGLPDVVFLDLGLPGFDGYEVARLLRHGDPERTRRRRRTRAHSLQEFVANLVQVPPLGDRLIAQRLRNVAAGQLADLRLPLILGRQGPVDAGLDRLIDRPLDLLGRRRRRSRLLPLILLRAGPCGVRVRRRLLPVEDRIARPLGHPRQLLLRFLDRRRGRQAKLRHDRRAAHLLTERARVRG